MGIEIHVGTGARLVVRDVAVAERILVYLAEGPRGASLATLRRRAAYGGRKGRRAARRLRSAGVTP